MTASRPTIVVVAAVIEEGDAFLVTERPTAVHLGGLWEFPGGKVDPPETHIEALRRELREELDVDAEVGELVFEVEHDYADRSVTLHFYRCTLTGRPRPLLGQQMRWATRDQLREIEFPPADEELIRRLVST